MMPRIRYIAILAFCMATLYGCGQSYDERQKIEEEKRNGQLKKNKEQKQESIAQIESSHQAKYFPPTSINESSYTYEIQTILNDKNNNPVVFRGIIDDIEQNEGAIFVNFISPLGERFITSHRSVLFRLRVPKEKLNILLSGDRASAMMRSLKSFYNEKYYIVANINDVRSMRHYEFDGTSHGTEIDFSVDLDYSILSEGQLIDVYPIENGK